jgi:thiamine kinase
MTENSVQTISEIQQREANAFLDGNACWQKIDNSGTTNSIYRGTLNKRSFILRLNQQNSALIGVCRQRENSVLKIIQPYPWAVNVIHNNWRRGWCLMQDHGRRLTPGNTCDSSRQQIYTLMAHCQSPGFQWADAAHAPSNAAAASDLAINYSTLLNSYRCFFGQHVIEKNAAHVVGERINNLILDIERLQELILHTQDLLQQLPKLPHCLVHHDLHPGNICLDNQQIKVIDWEYAGIGNPLIDAIALRRHWDFSMQDLASLPIFSQLKQQDLKQGLDISEQVVDSLETLWSRAQTISKTTTKQRTA